MYENYPFFNVVKRRGVNLEKLYEENKIKIADSNSNLVFLHCLHDICKQLPGHVGPQNPARLHTLYSGDPNRSQCVNITADTVSNKNFNLYRYFDMLYSYKNNTNSYISHHPSSNSYTEEENNITTKIIEEGKIAYIKINSFGSNYICDETQKTIAEFFNITRNYDNIIIDITGNDGGSTSFIQYFAPIIKKNITVNNYILLKNGEQSQPFLHQGYHKNLSKINKLPKFPQLTAEDKAQFTWFCKRSYHYFKSPKTIKGKAWLLVDDKVFSASERFARLCKQTGFATLVGKSTAGDGLGIDPFLMKLPNSKLIYRYSGDYGLNPDGSCNAEVGTVPDIISPENETPFETCLREIKSQSK